MWMLAKETVCTGWDKLSLRASGLSHFTQVVVGIPVTRDGFHKLITEEDDDSTPLVLHHHRCRR